MKLRSKLARVAALLFSLTLLAGYVIYSHVTPNTPPPDPLGLNEGESKQEPDTPDFDGIVKANNTTPSTKRSGNDLRIISSKVINQPIFRVADRDRQKNMPEMRVATAGFKAPGFQMVRNLEVIPGPGDSAVLPFDSLLKRPANALEQPENIGRIMADDGSHFSESRQVITVGNLAAEKRRDEYFRITGGRFAWYPPPPPRYPIDPMLWPLVELILSLDKKDGNSLPWNKP
jgi:hypothetical protein